MAWFYNSHSGQAFEDNNPLTEWGDVLRTKTGTGWHEYGTEQQMLAAIKSNGWPGPSSGPSAAGAGKIAVGTGQAAASGLTGIPAIGAFFSSLSNPHLWLRIAEGVLGVILIATAVSKIAGGSAAGQIARKIPLVV